MSFEIGQTFEGSYPPEAAEWCNERDDCHIEEIEPLDGERRFEIVENSYEDSPVPEDPFEPIDAAICELYEQQLEQSAIIDDQDAAICALYEMIGE